MKAITHMLIPMFIIPFWLGILQLGIYGLLAWVAVMAISILVVRKIEFKRV